MRVPVRTFGLFLLLWPLALGSRPSRAEVPSGGNLTGLRGLLRTSAASGQPKGFFGVGAELQYFRSGNFLAQGQTHARLANTYSVSFAPFSFLEAAFLVHVISDSSSLGSTDELQVAVGDPELAIKGGYAIGGGFALGGLFDLRFPSGAGFFKPAGAATNLLVAALGSWTLSPRVPLGVHLNVGFQLDGSKNLFDNAQQLTPAQRFAGQLSSFHRVVTRFGVEYNSPFLGPFVELSLEPFVGGGAPGFGQSPGVLSLGAKVWPARTRGLEFLAAVDIGLTGVGSGAPPTLEPGKYAFVIPRWNLLFRLSYRFDPFAKPEVRIVKQRDPDDGGTRTAALAPGVALGRVLDARTGQPIAHGRVELEGTKASGLAVDAADGSFRTYPLSPGPHAVVATAEGYERARAEVQIRSGGEAQVELKLSPRDRVTPGTLRGTLKAVGGKDLPDATILIPELDRTIPVDRDGNFTVSLKPGEYRLVVSAKGYRAQRKTIRVSEGSTVILNVELYR
ncbi:MAG: carboxypeptidase regulatory-like domain-containing protein [Deltaproteobacteria bacterium]|nr:carboxypeptidase regulatory-like domain-containing protein [Deltaproteobacteria bacterium]